MAQLFADNPKERDAYVGLITANGILGATIGAFVVMPFAAGNGGNLFYAIWLAIGLTVLAWFLAFFVLVSPPKVETVKEVTPTPKAARKLLITTSIASSFATAISATLTPSVATAVTASTIAATSIAATSSTTLAAATCVAITTARAAATAT